jgi:hypothetical protein
MELVNEFEEAQEMIVSGRIEKCPMKKIKGRERFKKALLKMVLTGIKRIEISKKAGDLVGCSKESFNARLSNCVLKGGAFEIFIKVLTGELKKEPYQEEIDKNPQYVYVINNLDNGKIKIGMSINPKSRVRGIITGQSIEKYDYKIFEPVRDALAVEKKAHKFLDKYRSIGEWFIMNYEQALDAVELNIKLFEYKNKWGK